MDIQLSPTEKQVGQRIDAVLARYKQLLEKLPTITRAAIARLIESSHVLINEKSIKPSYKLKLGDKVTITIPEDFLNPHALMPNPDLNIPIIFENEDFLVIDKPAGIQSHPASTAKIVFSDVIPATEPESTRSERRNPESRVTRPNRSANAVRAGARNDKNGTVVNWFVGHYPQSINVGDDSLRPGIVHRLDKDTTGLMIIAKTQKAFNEFKRLFHNREVEKTYLTLVHGHLKEKKGTIDTPIARAHTLRKQSIATPDKKVRGTIRSAFTHYKVLESYKDFDLVLAKPKTGRMHQIRLHLASLGHPIVGDSLYTPKNLKKLTAVPHHLLHAHKLEFTLFEIPYIFTSPPPPDFLRLLKAL